MKAENLAGGGVRLELSGREADLLATSTALTLQVFTPEVIKKLVKMGGVEVEPLFGIMCRTSSREELDAQDSATGAREMNASLGSLAEMGAALGPGVQNRLEDAEKRRAGFAIGVGDDGTVADISAE